MHIKIKNRFLRYKGYKLKCSVGKSGIAKFKKEGDLATPKGIYSLGLFYYRKEWVYPLAFFFSSYESHNQDPVQQIHKSV